MRQVWTHVSIMIVSQQDSYKSEIYVDMHI